MDNPVCVDCGKEIHAKRVAVLMSWGMPAERCVECQAFYDARRPVDFHAPAFAVQSELDKEGWVNG